MAILLGGKEPQWPNATHPTVSAGGGRQPMFPHYNMRYQPGTASGYYFPGFSDDAAAGSAIKMTYETYGRGVTQVDYYNKAGTAITDGVWNGGFTFAEVTGAEAIVGYMMDEVDECLYFLAVNTGTAPDQYKLCSVDKEGVLTEAFAWTDPSGTSFDAMGTDNYTFAGTLSRTGAAQDGNFVFLNTRGQIGIDGAAAPYRGAIMTFAESDGALTESNLTDVDTGGGSASFNHMSFGPTSNNIWMGSIYAAGGMNNKPQISIVNATTGAGFRNAYLPLNTGSTPQTSAGDRTMPMRWRGYYCTPIGAGTLHSPMWYTVDDMHNYVDEMAVKFGIL